MKKLRTKNKVEYVMPPNVKKTGYIEMVLGNVSLENNFTRIGVNHSYFGINDDGTIDNISNSAFYMDEVAINYIFEAIKPLLPTDVTYVENLQNEYYTGSIFKMAETFAINPADIEMIDMSTITEPEEPEEPIVEPEL